MKGLAAPMLTTAPATGLSDPAEATTAQALELYAQAIRENPTLITLRNQKSYSVLTYQGYGVKFGAEDAPKEGRVDLLVEMDVPPIPSAR